MSSFIYKGLECWLTIVTACWNYSKISLFFQRSFFQVEIPSDYRSFLSAFLTLAKRRLTKVMWRHSDTCTSKVISLGQKVHQVSVPANLVCRASLTLCRWIEPLAQGIGRSGVHEGVVIVCQLGIMCTHHSRFVLCWSKFGILMKMSVRNNAHAPFKICVMLIEAWNLDVNVS